MDRISKRKFREIGSELITLKLRGHPGLEASAACTKINCKFSSTQKCVKNWSDTHGVTEWATSGSRWRLLRKLKKSFGHRLFIIYESKNKVLLP